MLGSRLAVYTTSFVMVHAIFINPLENGHAHVLEGVSVFIILVGPYLSVSIERLKTYVLTSSPAPFSFVFSGSLRVDGPSPLSSWRWVLEAGSAPVELLAARVFGKHWDEVELDSAHLIYTKQRDRDQWTLDHPEHKQRVFHAPLTFVIAHQMSSLSQG
jgi:hypothetical protein